MISDKENAGLVETRVGKCSSFLFFVVFLATDETSFGRGVPVRKTCFLPRLPACYLWENVSSRIKRSIFFYFFGRQSLESCEMQLHRASLSSLANYRESNHHDTPLAIANWAKQKQAHWQPPPRVWRPWGLTRKKTDASKAQMRMWIYE